MEKPDALVKAKLVKLTPISGRVTRPDGSAAPGILVAAKSERLSAYPPGSGTAITAVDGSYSMNLPPGESYAVSVADDEWAGPAQSDGCRAAGEAASSRRESPACEGCVDRGPGDGGRDRGAGVRAGGDAHRSDKGRLAAPGAARSPRGVTHGLYRPDGCYSFRVAPGSYDLIGPYSPIITDGEGFKISARRRSAPRT